MAQRLLSLVQRLPHPVKRAIDLTLQCVMVPVAWAAAPVVWLMAYSGVGTNFALRWGALPMQVHFYSPVPDLADLTARDIWSRRTSLAGIDLRADEQVKLLGELGRDFASECRWPLEPAENPTDYHVNNGAFSYGCAAATHSMIRRFKPQRVIEIGSGNSTKVISRALALNTAEGSTGRHVVVDPYPGEVVRVNMKDRLELKPQRVELLEPEFFDCLEANDILFIDSGHTVRIGSDVNFLFLDVLPRLKPGVIVHVHDIPLPFEYPSIYYTNPKFRVFWTEAYLLQAFLCHNAHAEVLLAMCYLMSDHLDAVCKAFPEYDPSTGKSGSFWFRIC